jgi:hypothetical protein
MSLPPPKQLEKLRTALHAKAKAFPDWLEERAKEIQDKTSQPQPLRRVWIPKLDGNGRRLRFWVTHSVVRIGECVCGTSRKS